MANIFQLIRPNSISDSNYEEFEFLIRWIGRSGGEHVYMFYDAELRNRARTNVINKEDSDNIRSIIRNEDRSIRLFANDLTKNELEIISGLFINPYVERILTDGTTERLATDSNSIRYKARDGRYEMDFTLIRYERPLYI